MKFTLKVYTKSLRNVNEKKREVSVLRIRGLATIKTFTGDYWKGEGRRKNVDKF
jgi:hypothetical protein